MNIFRKNKFALLGLLAIEIPRLVFGKLNLFFDHSGKFCEPSILHGASARFICCNLKGIHRNYEYDKLCDDNDRLSGRDDLGSIPSHVSCDISRNSGDVWLDTTGI
jgi:hypothetical protein